MIKYDRKRVSTEIVKDIVCDSCGQSTKDKYGMNYEYAIFNANWGYGSTMDDTRWEYHLCEQCAIKVRDFLELDKEKKQ